MSFNSTQISIVIADDHEVVRDGIRARLQEVADLKIIAEAKNGSEAVDQVSRYDPDVVMLDISMPILNGLETARKIRENGQACKILMLSIYDATEYVQGAVKAGANGYLLKDASAKEMVSAIRSVAAGGLYFSAKVAPSLMPQANDVKSSANQTDFSTLPEPKKICTYGLSTRERQVLRAIAQGLANKEIALNLSISVRTVESHRLNIREKTGGGNTAQLTRIASELQLI
ncbi:MAG: response regulator transcription factor [Hyphomicrobiales bacterium]|uniref:response regulator transcription factor n=1 Tax=Nisaea sp. TaxID=2024842 RepID=UPI003295DCF3